MDGIWAQPIFAMFVWYYVIEHTTVITIELKNKLNNVGNNTVCFPF